MAKFRKKPVVIEAMRYEGAEALQAAHAFVGGVLCGMAPTLRALLFPDHNRRPVPDAWLAMKREYSALLAVARAAERESLAVRAVAREARNTHPGELDGDRIGRLLEDSDARMARALSRLRAAGKRGGGRT